MMRRLVSAIAVLGLVACAPGAAYDNLTGGTKTATEDSALAAPRPISPVSVSMVATSRPRLAWRLAGAATGAIVELSKTRAFDGEIKQYQADGSELVVPEDLDAGIWFWRLTSKTISTVGTKTSPAWEVLVRGPAAHGTSDTPTGSIVDLDGDGVVDLLAIYDDAWDMDGKTYGPFVLPIHGDASGQLTPKLDAAIPLTSRPTPDAIPVALAGGTDGDGDGISDTVVGWRDPDAQGNLAVMFPGDAKRLLSDGYQLPIWFSSSSLAVREAGDPNADGFGDYLVSDSVDVKLVLGGAPSATQYVTRGGVDIVTAAYFPPGMPRPTDPYALLAGFDADGDGIADLALGFQSPTDPAAARLFSSSTTSTSTSHHLAGDGSSDGTTASATAGSPIALLRGGSGSFADLGTVRFVDMDPRIAKPVALASGDFDGDGLSDVASSIAIGAKRRVCVWYSRPGTTPAAGPCIDGGADLDFGSSMTAADVEGDGIDELLVTSREGGGCVKVLRADSGITVVAKVPGVGPTVLTTIWPGRPGAARWAALSADAGAIRVFEGTTEKQTLPHYDYTRGFGRALR